MNPPTHRGVTAEHAEVCDRKRAWAKKNRLLINQRNRARSYLTPEEQREYDRIRRWADPEPYKARSRKSKLKHRDALLARRRDEMRLNINGRREKQQQWNRANRQRCLAASRARYRRRMQDPRFRIEAALRARMASLMKGRKSANTIRLLGCSYFDFKIYLESKFEPGMTWDNYGSGVDKWNIDHIMPCAIFDLTKPEHQRRCFHFSNLQPLWWQDNIRKHANVVSDQFWLL